MSRKKIQISLARQFLSRLIHLLCRKNYISFLPFFTNDVSIYLQKTGQKTWYCWTAGKKYNLLFSLLTCYRHTRTFLLQYQFNTNTNTILSMQQIQISRLKSNTSKRHRSIIKIWCIQIRYNIYNSR